jgi:hypothetical protein
MDKPMTMLILDPSKRVGGPDHLEVFANADAAVTDSRKMITGVWALGAGAKELNDRAPLSDFWNSLMIPRRSAANFSTTQQREKHL